MYRGARKKEKKSLGIRNNLAPVLFSALLRDRAPDTRLSFAERDVKDSSRPENFIAGTKP